MPKILNFLKTDQKIIDSIQNGDDNVLGILYEKNLTMITKLVKDNSGTENDSAELLQDALVILWEKIRKNEFELRSKISTFLYAVVKRKWLQELARRKKYTELNEVVDHSNNEPSAEANLQEAEMIDMVKSCMRLLSPLCQNILTAYYYENKSMSEISKLYSLANENVAKSKKYQCKKHLEDLVRAELR